MGLVWQALSRVKSVALQVVRHLDCRQGLPVDSLEPPSSYAPVSKTPVDADAHVQVAELLAEPVADAGAAPVKPADSSEPATEELPHDVPTSATGRPKSVLRSPGGGLRQRGVTFSDGMRPIKDSEVAIESSTSVVYTPKVVSLFQDLDLPPGSSDLLDFTLPPLLCGDGPVKAFQQAVSGHVFRLCGHVENWKQTSYQISARLDMLGEVGQELQGLITLTKDFMESLKSQRPTGVTAREVQKLLDVLEDKLIDLQANVARTNAHMEGQRSLLRAGIESVEPAPIKPETPNAPSYDDCADFSEASSDDDNAYRGLDFSALEYFVQNSSTEYAAKAMYIPITRLVDEISDLKNEAGEQGQTIDGQVLAVEGIVDRLEDLQAVLRSNLCNDEDLGNWMLEKMDEVQLELQEWERALDSLRTKQATGPRPY